ncbi:MFS transporter [Streptosporangium sp. NPDC048865]|uniref:MFS transporter n=1 Tax=Streptosporangium sp. NPDC048865 TaxID=3155766 RepID=UPI00343E9202
MRARLPLRLTRAAVFSAVCLALAVLGHAAAGGSWPRPWAVAVAGAAVTATALLLAGRERSTVTINTGLAALQLSLHELFVLGDAAGVPPPHPHARGLGENLGMLVAHLTATLITGWWLARGESALWALLRSAGRRLGAMFPLLRSPAAAVAPPRGPVYAPGTPVPARAVLRHSVSRRGPPLPAA